MNLEQAIQLCIDAKVGDKEFSLQFIPYNNPEWSDWSAEIGNPVSAVRLGESEGEYCGKGKTALEAVQNLLKELTK